MTSWLKITARRWRRAPSTIAAMARDIIEMGFDGAQQRSGDLPETKDWPSPKRKRSWLLLEWVGTVLLGRLPDIPQVNRALAKLFYYFVNKDRLPNLSSPHLFNEKLINLKLSDEACSPLRSRITDKELVKAYVTEKLGAGFVTPTLKVLSKPREIDDYSFPTPCVVKPTHSSQEVMFLNAKQPTRAQKRLLKYWMSKSYYATGREPNYRMLEKKLIVEPVLGGAFGRINDVKVFCFNGQAKFLHVDRSRFDEPRRDFYDLDGSHLPVKIRFEHSGEPFPYKNKLSELINISKILSQDFSFIRVDFYIVDDEILVGELTSFPSNCTQPIQPLSADLAIARLFDEPDLSITPEFFAPQNRYVHPDYQKQPYRAKRVIK